MQAALPNFVVSSEGDAFQLLETLKSLDESTLGDIDIKLDGWPVLDIVLKGKEFNSTITPTIMAGLLEFQKALYRSFALTKYNSVNINKLTKTEKDELEIKVSVNQGSSLIGIDLQKILEKFMENASSKLDKKTIFGIALVAGICYAGPTAYKTFLEERRLLRQAELTSQEEIEKLEGIRFAEEQETERMKMLSDLVSESSQLSNIKTYSEESKSKLIKAIRKVDQVFIEGVEIDGETATELSKNARNKATPIRLDGIYRVLVVDTTLPDHIRIKVKDLSNGDIFFAGVFENTVELKHRVLIQEAEWSKSPISLQINARAVGGEIKAAQVLSAKNIDIESKN